MKVLYLDCPSGISGDMFLGALLDAGLKLSVLEQQLAALNLDGFTIRRKTVMRHHVKGTKFDVVVHRHPKAGRSLKHIVALIRRSNLDSSVKELAINIFMTIAKAEARVHNRALEQLHFHEVGQVDAIVDIVGAAIGVTALGIETVYGSPLTLGQTAPATLRIVKGCRVRFSFLPHELVTPTGAAIYKTLITGTMPPPMEVAEVGYGAGDMTFDETPNLLRAIIGSTHTAPYNHDRVMVIETNIDDTNPVIYEHVMDRLFAVGARDVFMTPAYAKKSRMANVLTVLTDEAGFWRIAAVLFEETSTIGMRYYYADRLLLKRTTKRVKTRHGTVHVKMSTVNNHTVKTMPEYEDCKRLANKAGVPLQRIYQEILETTGGS
jgi:uncharacterized protein (TIGR00299 family) protein